MTNDKASRTVVDCDFVEYGILDDQMSVADD
jgi:hypothetical protein